MLMFGLLSALPALDVQARTGSGWSRPLRLVGPLHQDLQPPQVATLGPRSVIIASGSEDVDAPATAAAMLIIRGQHGGFRAPRALRGSQRVLALTLGLGGFTLLAGSATSGQTCCSTVTAIDSTGRRHRILTGLDGPTQARLLEVGGRLLAAVATERGVWVSETGRSDRHFGPVRELSARGEFPQNLALAAAPGARGLVAWTARAAGVSAPGPRTIYLAKGSAGRPPSSGHPVVNVASGHQIDELALAGAPGDPLVVWIESWFDHPGAFHSEVRAQALASRSGPARLSPSGQLATGLAVAAAGAGPALVAFSSCAQRSDTCTATVATRRRGGRFGPRQRLGAVDAGQPVSATVAGDGRAVVGWISAGRVLAATAPPDTGRGFGGPVRISSSGLASELTLANGPGAGAVAVWNEATVAQQVLGAFLR